MKDNSEEDVASQWETAGYDGLMDFGIGTGVLPTFSDVFPHCASNPLSPAEAGVGGALQSFEITPTDSESPSSHNYRTRLQVGNTGKSLFPSNEAVDTSSAPSQQGQRRGYQTPTYDSDSEGSGRPHESEEARLERLIQTDAKTGLKVAKFREVFTRAILEYAQDQEKLTMSASVEHNSEHAQRIPILMQGTEYIGSEMQDPPYQLAKQLLLQVDRFCSDKGIIDANLQRQKFYELFQNLRRSNNRQLRIRIITGDLPIKDLVEMDAKELAPESLKKKREEEAEKYFKQQVILQEDPKASIIIKTHKGIETIAAPTLETKRLKAGGSKDPSPAPSPRGVHEDLMSSKIELVPSVPWAAEIPSSDEISPMLQASGAPTPPEGATNEGTLVSTPAFSAVEAKPWTELFEKADSLLQKARITELPPNPSEFSFTNTAERLMARLGWLQDQHLSRSKTSSEHYDGKPETVSCTTELIQ